MSEKSKRAKLVARLREMSFSSGQHRDDRDRWAEAADEIERMAAIIVTERIDTSNLRAQLAEAMADRDRWSDRHLETFTAYKNADDARAEAERQRDALREIAERLDKVIGDTEWWEEVELAPYNGNIREALDAEFGQMLADTILAAAPADGEAK